jgi:hypothetical protein
MTHQGSGQAATIHPTGGTMTEFQLGSISTGTLFTGDLIAAFANALLGICDGNAEATELARDSKQYLEPDIDDTDEEFRHSLVESLTDYLNEFCPPFVYFGTHPGDGADFGFWPDLEAIDASCEREHHRRTHNPDTGEIVLEDDSVIVQVNDHGNVTVMDMERSVIWSVA